MDVINYSIIAVPWNLRCYSSSTRLLFIVSLILASMVTVYLFLLKSHICSGTFAMVLINRLHGFSQESRLSPGFNSILLTHGQC